MSKKLFILIVMAVLACSVTARSLRQHQVFIVDEFGDAVTNIDSITIFDAGTSTQSTIFSDRAGDISVTNPVTTSSTNSTFDQSLGLIRWFQAAADFKITVLESGASKTLTLDNLNESNTRFAFFANYIGALSSFNIGDDNDLNFGTDTDVVGTWENANNILSWIPAVDGVAFDIGDSGTTANMDFNVYVGTALGLKIDEGVPSFTWDGGAANINASSNFATNINTGTSTGAIAIGSSTAGAITVDTTSTITINSDAQTSITTTDGSADILIDASAGSVIIRGTEAVADAIVIDADTALGGIDITSNADIDITTTGTAGEDISITNTGGSVIIIATEGITDAIVLNASTAVGGIDITSNADIDITTTGAAGEDISITNTGGSINLSATEAIADATTIDSTAGGVDISCAATFDIDITATGGRVIITGNEAVDDAVTLTATGAAGGIDITSLGDIDITTTGAAGEDIAITNTGGSISISATEAVADALTISTTAAGGDLNLDSVLGRIEIEAEEDVADAIFIIADGGTTTTMKLLNDTGTSATDAAASIQITSDLGGIEMLSSLAAANQIRLNAAGTVAGFAVVLETTDGGIQLNADGAANGDITVDAADVLSLIAGDAAGLVTTVGGFEHKGIFYNFSAGIVSASEMIVEPGQGLLCVGLTAGAAEIGSTEGFVGSDTETDFIRFMITMPDDWVDTGTQADVILTFDIDEQAAEECNIDFRMFEYDGAANTTAILTDTIVAADDGTRAFKPLVTNSAGIGNEADLKPGSVYIIELTGNAGADDFDIYGMKMVYRVGLQPSE